MKRSALLLIPLLLFSISAKAWEIDWKHVIIVATTATLGIPSQDVAALIALIESYQQIDDYLEKQAQLREQELQTKICNLQSEIAKLNDVKKKIEDNSSVCEETSKFVVSIIEAQIEEANAYIDAAKLKKMPSFNEEINLLSGCLALEDHLLQHLSQCDTCSQSPIRPILIKKYSADKEYRRQHLACIEEWIKQGFKNQEEMEKEKVFEKQLRYLSQLSEIAKNLSSAFGIGR